MTQTTIPYLFLRGGTSRGPYFRRDDLPADQETLSQVLIAAIEMGLVPAQDGETRVRIHAVNTGAVVEARVQTPGGRVSYAGDFAIAGVPGTAAPIALGFMETVGSVTGAMLPTGNLRDVIDGVEVTCMDVAMPVMLARAADFGLTGYETQGQLHDNRAFFARVEAIRLQAGERMGLGLADCASPVTVGIEHPAGTFDVLVDFDRRDGGLDLRSAGVVRTARLLARGQVMVPATLWAPPA